MRQTVAVTQVWGMHARPCAMLIRALEPFDCEVLVQSGDHVVNGRSILGLLSLAAGCHSKLKFTTSGVDAGAAMVVITRLFESGFEQAYAEKPKTQASAGTR